MKLTDLKKKDLKKLNNQHKNALLKLERKTNLMPLLVFSLIAIVLVGIILATYPLIKDVLPKMFDSYPEEIKQLLLSLTGSGDYSNYFTMQMGQTWGLLTVIYGSYLGYYLISNNFKGKSSTLLYSLNLSRNKIVFAKIYRILINTIIFNGLIGICSGAITYFLDIPNFNYVNLLIYTLFMIIIGLQSALFIFGIALLNPKKVSAVLSFLVPVILYFFATISLADESLKIFSYLTPVSAVFIEGSKNIINSGFVGVNYLLVAVWTIIPLVLLLKGLIKFNKSDLI